MNPESEVSSEMGACLSRCSSVELIEHEYLLPHFYRIMAMIDAWIAVRTTRMTQKTPTLSPIRIDSSIERSVLFAPAYCAS